MNKHEALKSFVEDYLPLLTSPAFARQALKEPIRKAFVDEHRKRFGIPTNKEIAEALVKFSLTNELLF